MSAKQSQDKIDKRAKALRENLRKRKPVSKSAAKGGKSDDVQDEKRED